MMLLPITFVLFFYTQITQTSFILDKIVPAQLYTIDQAMQNDPEKVGPAITNFLETIEKNNIQLDNIPFIKNRFQLIAQRVKNLSPEENARQKEINFIKIEYYKLCYAFYIMEGKDLCNKELPIKEEINGMINVLHTYINLHNRSFYQSFPGLVNYEPLLERINIFLENIAKPTVHLYIPYPINDILEYLISIKKMIMREKDCSDFFENIPIDYLRNTLGHLESVKEYLQSPLFYSTLPFMHYSLQNDSNPYEFAPITNQRPEFLNWAQYIRKMSQPYVNYPYRYLINTIQNGYTYKEDYYSYIKRKAIVSCVILPTKNTLEYVNKYISNIKMPWYNFTQNIGLYVAQKVLGYSIKTLENIETTQNQHNMNVPPIFQPPLTSGLIEKILACNFHKRMDKPSKDQLFCVVFLPEMINLYNSKQNKELITVKLPDFIKNEMPPTNKIANKIDRLIPASIGKMTNCLHNLVKIATISPVLENDIQQYKELYADNFIYSNDCIEIIKSIIKKKYIPECTEKQLYLLNKKIMAQKKLDETKFNGNQTETQSPFQWIENHFNEYFINPQKIEYLSKKITYINNQILKLDQKIEDFNMTLTYIDNNYLKD